jgi:hypothetical protein
MHVGEKIPYFELTDLEGRKWTPRDLDGRRAVVFCFATW